MVDQQLEVTLSIPIPKDYVLIKRVELEKLKSNELKGVYWSMKDLEKRTGKGSAWIKENILYPSSFRNTLDAETGGFVFYPTSRGQGWTFQASRMAEFLDNNFRQIFRKGT